MNKDVIYIDVEDDITAIIGKIKSSKDKIVALVPPKRIGILQSAVNLRLLSRMAKKSHKHLVIITSNQALIVLSATAQIPIAKNLQSKPEIAEIAALDIDDGEDIIDGAQLPVGELAKSTDETNKDDVSDAIDTIDIETDGSENAKKDIGPKSKSKAKAIKVPDFSSFRKKLFIALGILPLLVAFFVWAIFYAPAAKVIITAKTSPAPVSMALKLGGSAATDVSKNIIQSLVKQAQQDLSVEFTATGKKDESAKATGTIDFSISCGDVGSDPVIIPAGNQVTSTEGKVYLTQNSIYVTTPVFSGGCYFVGSGSVAAEATGEEYNNVADDTYTVDGFPDVSGTGTAMTGGLTKITTIVTAADVQKASQVLVALSSDSVKQQLLDEFKNGEYVIDESFDVDRATPVSEPAIGEEAATKAKLTSKTTYSIVAIAKSELQVFLKNTIEKQITNTNTQRVYDDGIDNVILSGYITGSKETTVNMTALGKIGPNIDQDTVKEQIKGLRYGDVQSLLERNVGVSSVDVQFSYFWVNTVPSDDNKIEVEFVLQDE
jgi:hypothetical protein